MRLLFLLTLFSLFICQVSAQIVKGKITDNSGAPIPNAAVFIKELALGITADDNGEFQISSLKEGNYTCEFSSLGYERKVMQIAIDKTMITITSVMEKKTYAIKEVVVSRSKENPAYAIMRKAISMAPFYLNQIKSYESNVYMKGNIKIDKIPKLFKIKTGSGQDMKDFTNKLFVLESHNEVSFSTPNKYQQKVVAFSTTLPIEMNAEKMMSVTTSNIYDPKVYDNISPLAPNAFAYYQFTFDGVSMEGEYMVNKIRVQPKKKNAKLFSGWLYIIENSWNIHSVDLKTSEFGATMHFKTAYNEVKPNTFLPTSYDINYNIDVMGVKANGKYYSSIQYTRIALNELQGVIHENKKSSIPITITDKPQTKQNKKIQQKIEKLANKEELSNRDSYQLAKLMTQATESKEDTKTQKSLELRPSGSNVTINVDTLARSRDSVYWSTVRNLPLKPEEKESYQLMDSLQPQQKLSKDNENSIEIGMTSGEGKLGKILFGNQKSVGKNLKFGYKGLLGMVPEYNFTDGFWLGERFILSSDISKTKSLSISPSAYFLTARKTMNWQVDASFNYSPLKNGKLRFSAGKTTADFNSQNGTLRLINSISSLFFAENPIRFYQKEFIEIKNDIDLVNGLILTTGVSLENRNSLENHCSYNFFGNIPKANIPFEGYSEMMDNDKITKANIQISYTPMYYYRVFRGKKTYIYSDYPTLTLELEKGFTNNNSSFSKLELGIKQVVKLNEFDNLHYSVKGGSIFSGEHIQFPDYKHFNTNELFITSSSLENSFSLLNNYAYSTNKNWLEGHVSYSSDYLLFKRLPFLQNKMFNESIHAHSLWIKNRDYLELGYSMGFSDLLRLGVFVGLENRKYDAFGVTISLPILKSVGLK